MSKPFKETKLGKFLSEKAPSILDAIDDVFPPAKILTALVGEKLSPEDKLQFDKLALEYEQNERKDYLADVQNARSREVEMAKAGKRDWFMQAVGIFVLLAFAYFCYAAVYLIIPESNKENFLDLKSTIRDAVIAIIFYYFGSSKRSSDKN